MESIKKLSDLFEALSSKIELNKKRIIAVDGFMGQGKTFLGKVLASEFDCHFLDTDWFQNKETWDNDSYIKHVTDNGIIEKLPSIITDFPSLVIAGCCVMHFLKEIPVKPDFHIYCKRKDPQGNWLPLHMNLDMSKSKEDLLNYYDESEDKLLEEKKRLGMSTERMDNGFEREVLEYHGTFRPHDKADICYEWQEKYIPPLYLQ